MFIGAPLSFVSVIVPLAAGAPTTAGFVTTITVLQTTLFLSAVPSTNCGKYKVVCAEQMPAAQKTTTTLSRMFFTKMFFIEFFSLWACTIPNDLHSINHKR